MAAREQSVGRFPGIDGKRAALAEAQAGIDADAHLAGLQDADTVAERAGVLKRGQHHGGADTSPARRWNRRDLIDTGDASSQKERGHGDGLAVQIGEEALQRQALREAEAQMDAVARLENGFRLAVSSTGNLNPVA